MGKVLREGLIGAAEDAGHRISYSGPDTMPTMLFENDPERKKQRAFAHVAARLGAILPPFLNWNLSAAHGAPDIDETIEIAARAFEATSR